MPAIKCLASVLVVVLASFAVAEPAKDSAAKPELKLPPGYTDADMQACMAAATPGKMQEHLTKDAGTWRGKQTMWMAPGAEPMKTEVTATLSPIMDGRYLKIEIAGEMPGMGPFNGLGINGFDNVSQKFTSTWIDNMGTGIMTGTGDLSPDGKTLTWTYSFNCPITKKPTPMRQVETSTGPNTMTLEMFTNDPKSGKEYKMLHIEYTKQ